MTEPSLQPDPLDPRADHTVATLSKADAALIDSLLAGDAIGDDVSAERLERCRRLLGLLGHWQVADPEAGLAAQTVGAVLTADPASISDEDGRALEALLDLKRQDMEQGPMPSGTPARAEHVAGLLTLLDRGDHEAVPSGLAQRTMQRIERDREVQRQQSAMRIGGPEADQRRAGGFNLRQLATTAALLLMVFSVLLPMLEKGQRDAKIAQCSNNLAALGSGLQGLATDNKGYTQPASAQSPSIFRELSGFARKELSGETVPASRVKLFVLLDEQRIDPKHLTCPSADPDSNNAHYNGQNPIAGGPLRIFLKPQPIFADTNPLYRVTPTGLVRDATIPGLTRSANHDGVGQNVLISDGSVKWTVRPAVNQSGDEEDNIWLLQQSNQRDRDHDVFLTP